MALNKEQIQKLSDGALLAKIAEEASEVVKAAMKHQLHGAMPFWDGVQYDNVADTVEEHRQLSALMDDYKRRFCLVSELKGE